MIKRESGSASTQDIKNMFGTWALGIIIVIIGLIVIRNNAWAGTLLIVSGLIVVPFIIKLFIM